MTTQPFRFTFFLLICLLVLVTATAQTQTVNIPDPNLRTAIENELGKASGDTITVADMATLTGLSTPGTNISDLTGLKFATNLTELNLGYNSISDISPLAGLTNLTKLELWKNNISDISAVAGLTNLTGLILWDNPISDISPVAGLVNLIQLSLGGNNISDISPVAGLVNLIYLYLGENNISDISPLARLANLTDLRLAYNSISDISPLVANTGLGNRDQVHLSENPLSYPSIYTHIPTLQSRRVDVRFDNRIPTTLRRIPGVVTQSDNVLVVEVQDSEGRPFEGVPVTFTVISGGGTLSVTATMTDENGRAQTTLTLGTTGTPNNIEASAASIPVTATFSDVAEPVVAIPDPNLRAAIETALGMASGTPIVPSDMATLTHFEAGYANISNLTGLEFATNLTELNLGYNSISNISPLAELTNLTELNLEYNPISDISPLAELTNLTRLSLWNNTITDISPVAGLTNLILLNLGGNPISDISPAAGLVNLTHLYLGDNNISDISPMAGLINLIWLTLGGNSISDISPLAGLANLTHLHLEANSIADISPVAELTNLIELHLQGNSISDISPLVVNTGLRNGDEVHLLENPLSYPSIYTHILTLQNRRVDVRFGNRIPTTLRKISGVVTQSDNVLIIEVRDSKGRPFEGVPVTFTVISGGGTLSVIATTTDENGRAQTILTLGTTGTPNNVEASAASSRVTVTFSDVAEPVVDIPDPNLRAAIETRSGSHRAPQ